MSDLGKTVAAYHYLQNAFRLLRSKWFQRVLESHGPEREWEDDDRRQQRERDNDWRRAAFDLDTEAIIKSNTKCSVAPTCDRDIVDGRGNNFLGWPELQRECWQSQWYDDATGQWYDFGPEGESTEDAEHKATLAWAVLCDASRKSLVGVPRRIIKRMTFELSIKSL